jgi:hypothetical protein
MSDAASFFKSIATALEEREKHPYGPPAAGEVGKLAGEACVKLCEGNADKAITLRDLIISDLGYFPHCVAFSLIRASKPENLVPAVQPPELT